MAGALRAMADRTARYADERVQFGRAISGFQAVQALVVRCAEEAALVDLVAQVAARCADEGEARFRDRCGQAPGQRRSTGRRPERPTRSTGRWE